MKVDLDANRLSPEEAEQILNAVYKLYHGRTVDDTGRSDLLPLLTQYGFPGLVRVMDIVVRSAEMDERVRTELRKLWLDSFKREPTEQEYERYRHDVRCLRARGVELLRQKIGVAEVARRKAIALMKEGDAIQAHEVLEGATRNAVPCAWQFWHEHGRSLSKQELYDQAIASFQKSIDLHVPDDTSIWPYQELRACYEHMAQREHDSKWYQIGADYFQGIAEKHPHRWIVYHNCALLTVRVGKHQQAIPFYQQAIQHNSDDTFVNSCNNLRQCYEKARLQEVAFVYFSELVERHPKLCGAWYALATLAWKYKGDRELAVRLFGQAIETIPASSNVKWFEPWLDRGTCRYELGRYEDAYQDFQRACAIEPKNWEIWVRLGICYQQLPEPQYVRSWLAFQRALHLKPEIREAQRGQEDLGSKLTSELRKLFSAKLNLDEVRTICFDLGIDYEGLSGDGKSLKIIGLIEHCEKRKRIDELIRCVQDQRPDVSWPLP